MKTLKATLLPGKTLGTVPRGVFGHFVEHMYDCIDPGIWAELLRSRGFEADAVPETPGVSAPWRPLGEEASYALDTAVRYAPWQSQRVTLAGGVESGEGGDNSGGEYTRNTGSENGGGHKHHRGESGATRIAGVAQGGLLLEKDTLYTGHLWARADHAARVSVRVEGGGEPVFTHEYALAPGADWQRLDFAFATPKEYPDASLAFVLHTPGTLWMDSTSLCPKNAVYGTWPQVYKLMEALRPEVLRYPGGCAADCYHWQNGVGERDKRPANENRHWGGLEENNFGTDEFMALCRSLGAEPMLCVNFGTGSPQEAANGHPAPYSVTLWDIGNEAFGDWEIGHCTAEEYVRRYLPFAKAMRAKDPTITLVACGGDGNKADQSWNQTLLHGLRGWVDILSLHTYTPLLGEEEAPEEDIYAAVTSGAPAHFAGLLAQSGQTVAGLAPEVKLAVTEWNCNYGNPKGREQTMEAALCNAGMLHMFLARGEELAMCLYSDIVNGWPGGAIRSAGGRGYGTPSYQVLAMYAGAGLATRIGLEYEVETVNTQPLGNLPAVPDAPLQNLLAFWDRDDVVTLCAVNCDKSNPIQLVLAGTTATTATVQSLCGAYNATNGPAAPLAPQTCQCPVEGLVLPPCSVSIIKLADA